MNIKRGNVISGLQVINSNYSIQNSEKGISPLKLQTRKSGLIDFKSKKVSDNIGES
jgi:hypothetical protein